MPSLSVMCIIWPEPHNVNVTVVKIKMRSEYIMHLRCFVCVWVLKALFTIGEDELAGLAKAVLVIFSLLHHDQLFIIKQLSW